MGGRAPAVALAVVLMLAGCSQEPDMTLDEAEALLSATMRAVFAEVAPDGRVDAGTERWPCQDDLGRDSGEVRAATLGASGVRADTLVGVRRVEVWEEIRRVLERRAFVVDDPDDFGISGSRSEVRVGFRFQPDKGLVTASGRTACHPDPEV